MPHPLLLLLSAAGVSTVLLAIGPGAPRDGDRADGAVVASGEQLYLQNCAGCHGNEGKGDGPAATYLDPKPRDFTTGTFKITSTPQGHLPSDGDLLRIITEGMPGSAMPSWELLSEADRKAVVAYVKTLVKFYDEDEQKWLNRYELDDDVNEITIPPPTERTPEALARGSMLFRKAECWKCHGDEGRGDGIQAPALKDVLGYRIRPRDFTAGIFKGGNDPKELYKRVTIGINGTPMPAHSAAFTDNERWDLVHFILSLARPGAQELAKQVRKTITARRVEASKDWSDPRSELWGSQKVTYLALMPLWWRERRPLGILIKSVHDGNNIYVHMTWEDATENKSIVRSEDFRDGAAIQWARTDNAPFIAMGAGVEDVNIWLWKSERNDGPLAVAETHHQYPGYDIMDYPEAENWKPGEGDARNRSVRALGPKLAAGWSAGNPVSDPNITTPVENLAAHGFSTLTHLRKAMDHVAGKGAYDKGVWSVVMSRSFTTSDSTEAPLSAGKRIPAAFAVWDGSSHDRNGQKNITIWHDFNIEK